MKQLQRKYWDELPDVAYYAFARWRADACEDRGQAAAVAERLGVCVVRTDLFDPSGRIHEPEGSILEGVARSLCCLSANLREKLTTYIFGVEALRHVNDILEAFNAEAVDCCIADTDDHLTRVIARFRDGFANSCDQEWMQETAKSNICDADLLNFEKMGWGYRSDSREVRRRIVRARRSHECTTTRFLIRKGETYLFVEGVTLSGEWRYFRHSRSAVWLNRKIHEPDLPKRLLDALCELLGVRI